MKVSMLGLLTDYDIISHYLSAKAIMPYRLSSNRQHFVVRTVQLDHIFACHALYPARLLVCDR